MADNSQSTYIAVDQLCVGIYVYLDLSWLAHSFPLNSFKIKDKQQIEAIKQLGLQKIRINLARSDCEALPLQSSEPQATPALAEPTEAQIQVISAKKAGIERLHLLRETTAQCEEEFLQAVGTMKNISTMIFSHPEQAHQEAETMIIKMVDSLVTDKDIAIHLMSDKVAGEEVYFHSINVAVLGMMLAKELGMSPEDIRHIGVGSLFHDIGKSALSQELVKQVEPLTRAEQKILQQHPDLGVPIAQKLSLSPEEIEIIQQHHEYLDGSGFPHGLAGRKISSLARIVSIVNTYDNHCNRPNVKDSLSPYEALSFMFAQQRKMFDVDALNMFIRCMGVYPPGTIVNLSNDAIGMVVSVNAGKPLRPNVLIYDPDVPKEEAIVLDLQSVPDISVGHSLKPRQLSREMYDYLSPRKRMAYFLDPRKTDSLQPS